MKPKPKATVNPKHTLAVFCTLVDFGESTFRKMQLPPESAKAGGKEAKTVRDVCGHATAHPSMAVRTHSGFQHRTRLRENPLLPESSSPPREKEKDRKRRLKMERNNKN
ncbi:hypothetical protein RUM44_005386 [Polyplax serrata]|uniref:Uncharacterized protein n=1 Tax=Polyplax serrata TaxID=468196 RepID=A0ABR1AEP3_POLSC